MRGRSSGTRRARHAVPGDHDLASRSDFLDQTGEMGLRFANIDHAHDRLTLLEPTPADEQLKHAVYFHPQVTWLQDRFAGADYNPRFFDDICKQLATRLENLR